METFHIHIKGMVQGVGFRPFVHQLANEMNLCGYISNTKNGVHIEINGDENTADVFCQNILQHAPENALITGHSISRTITKSSYASTNGLVELECALKFSFSHCLIIFSGT